MNGFNSSADRAQYSVNGGNMLDSLEDFYIQVSVFSLLNVWDYQTKQSST